MRLLFLVRSLERGGAERQLVDLVRTLDPSTFSITVLTFYDGGALRPDLVALPDVQLLSLGKSGRWDVITFLSRLVVTTRRLRPDVIIGYLNVANELALLAGRAAGARVAWSLRSSYVDFRHYDWLSRWSFRIGALLSRYADAIFVNSRAGLQHHVACGYDASRMTMIANGIDSHRFRPLLQERTRIRGEWNVPDGVPLIGLVARLDPIKDHELFLNTAAIVTKHIPLARFVCVGAGEGAYATRLRDQARRLGIDSNIIWAGIRSDMAAVYNALDVSVCCSSGEGFPNTVAESMASGVPCAVTDVGDAVEIVGDTGEVAATRAPVDLATAIERTLERNATGDLGTWARQRIVERFSLSELKRSMESSLRELRNRRL